MVLKRVENTNFKPWGERNDKVSEAPSDFTARDYQIEMLNIAKTRNTIVMMPTGSGKTYVAVLLIRHYLYKVLSDPQLKGDTICGQWERTFFLVNQVTLVTQQAGVLRSHTGVDVGCYSGSHSRDVDKWDCKMWFHEFKKYQIFVMTAEIFKNLLSTSIIQPENVNVLVLDECHHAKENHPFAVILRDYWNPKDPTGKVLGLTASVIDKKKVSSKHELQNSIDKLEKMLRAKLVTPSEFVGQVDHQDLPSPEIQEYENGNYGNDILTFADNLVKVMDPDITKALPDIEKSSNRNIKKAVQSVPRIITEIGVDCLYTILKDDRGLINELDNYLASPLISRQAGTTPCITYQMGQVILEQLGRLRSLSQHAMESCSEVRMSEKFLKFIKYVLSLYYGAEQSGTEPPRIIVFAERRQIVRAMFTYLSKIRTEVKGCSGLKPCYVLGGTTGGTDSENMSEYEQNELKEIKKQQEQALLNFRNGKCNIMIATSVVEEGLDIPSCNVVIRYDFPQTYRAYVQSRGRARKKPAKFVFFISKEEVSEKKKQLKSFDEIEQLLKHYASDRTEGREDEDVSEESDYNLLIEPLEVEGGGAKITAVDAIQRLNFYCDQIPKDEYTDTMPIVVPHQKDGQFYCSITLPKLSPVKIHVEGDGMPNRKFAKMSAAMKALRELYKEGELTDELLPIFRQKESSTLRIHSEDGRSSTLDQRLKIPSLIWRKNLKEKPTTFHLHSIMMTLEPVVENFKEYFDFGKDHKVACYGILSKTVLPQLPVFPVYTRYGTVSVQIKYERAVTIPPHALPTYTWFQEALFVHTLDIKFVEFLPEALFKNYMITPLRWARSKKGGSANLELDSRFIVQLKKQWDEERQRWICGNMPQELEKCLDCVIFSEYSVMKDNVNYNNKDIHGALYSVIGISDLKPTDRMSATGSKKASDALQTYEQYHREKHGITLKFPEQHLLDCRNITRHYDYLRPQPTAQYEKKSRMTLVGEIHKVHPLPASLWNQTTCLPSILWRMEVFCLSKELTEIAYSNANLPISLLSSNFGDYFKEDVEVDLKTKLRRGEQYHHSLDWLETLQTITHKSCHEEFNLERLEFLGDRFLKFVSTLFYFRTLPDKHEGWLSSFRSKLVSNQNLAVRACKEIMLPRFILNKKISVTKNWIPPCHISNNVTSTLSTEITYLRSLTEEERRVLESPGKDDDTQELIQRKKGYKRSLLQEKVWEYLHGNHGNHGKETSTDGILGLCELLPEGHLQTMGEKDIADCMEALLGLCVYKYGYRQGITLLDRIKISTFQTKAGEEPKLFADYLYEPTPPPQILGLPYHKIRLARSRCGNLEPLERTLNYKFREPLYLLEAVTHASFEELDVCYQRLEFLGDAVLDVLVVFHAFNKKAEHDQGQLSDLMSSLVCNTTLSKISTKLELRKYLLYDSSELYNVMARFYGNFAEEELEAWCCDLTLDRVFIEKVEEDTTEGKIPIVNLDSKIVQTPKLLGDLLESVIGAVYLDSGEDLEVVWKVIWPWFRPFYESYSVVAPKNPRALIHLQYPDSIKREVSNYPENRFKFIAKVTISKRVDENSEKVRRYEFVTVGRDKETALDVSYGRAWHFHKKYLV